MKNELISPDHVHLHTPPKKLSKAALVAEQAAHREHNLHIISLIGAGVVAISLAMMGLHLVVESRKSKWEKAVDHLKL